MTSNKMRKAICHFYYILLGMVGVGLIPALTRSFQESFALSYENLGGLLTAGAGLFGLASIPSGLLYDRWGGRVVMVLTAALCALTAIAVALVDDRRIFMLLLPLFFAVNGLGAVVNPMVAWLYGERKDRGIGILHAFQCVGRLLAPLLVIASFAWTGSWRASFWFGAFCFVAAMALFWFFLPGPSAAAPAKPDGPVLRPRLFRDRTFLLGVFSFVLLGGTDNMLIMWVPNFIEASAGYAKARALQSLAVMMVGFTISRFALGVRRRPTGPWYVPLGLSLWLPSFFVLTWAPHRLPPEVPSLLAGLASGAFWPIVASDLYRYRKHGHGAVTTIMMLCITGGTMFFQYLIGYLASRYGLQMALLVCPTCAVAFGTIYTIFHIRAGRATAAPPSAAGQDMK